MSYARIGRDGSDVYVYQSVGDSEQPNGWIECCFCDLDDTMHFRAFTTAQMIEHLRAHQARGDTVPVGCFDELLAEAARLDAEVAR